MTAYTPKHRKDDSEVISETPQRPLDAEFSAGISAAATPEPDECSMAPESDKPRQSKQPRQSRQPRQTNRPTSSRGDRDRDRSRPRTRTRDRDGRPNVSAPLDSPKTSRFRISLALGIVFIVIALVIAVFLIYGSMSAAQGTRTFQAVAGMELSNGGEVAPDADLNDLKVNWDALKEINPDIVGWVMIPGTSINYPIVRASDNEFYLSHLADKTPNDNGAIFLDSENDPAISGWNNIIYGHNLLNGTMFARLKYYSEREFFDAHRTILLATPEKSYRLRVDAALVCDADDKVRRFSFSNREDYESYVGMLLEYAVINEIAAGEIPENLYGFVTCTDTNYSKRTMILASVVEERSS